MANVSKTTIEEMPQFEPDVFWVKYGSKIILAVLIVVALFAAAFLWQRQANDRAEAAASRLAGAQDFASLQSIVQDYPGQEPAAQALIRLADMRFQAGQYTEAATAYQQFLSQFSNHPLEESALLGQAAVTEAQGRLPEAMKQYELLARSHSQGYTTFAARIGQARCLEASGQLKEARQLYEEVMASSQGTPWAQMAYVRWVVLERDLPAAPPQPPSASQLAPVGLPGGEPTQPSISPKK